jgi:molecular chaperone GrpE
MSEEKGRETNAAGADEAGPEVMDQENIDAIEGSDWETAGADTGGGEPLEEEGTRLLKTELARLNDQLLRQAAEYQNYRRRADRERVTLIQAGRADVAAGLLDVLDDFERTLEASRQIEDGSGAVKALVNGVELVYRKMWDSLRSQGLERIEAKGQPFSEDEHEAMLQQPAPEGVEPGTVLDEIQPGYRMGDRVLRHTKVIVAN